MSHIMALLLHMHHVLLHLLLMAALILLLLMHEASLRAKLLQIFQHLVRHMLRLHHGCMRRNVSNLLHLLDAVSALVPRSWIDVNVDDSAAALRRKLVRLCRRGRVRAHVSHVHLQAVRLDTLLLTLARHGRRLLADHVALTIHSVLIVHDLGWYLLEILVHLLMLQAIDLQNFLLVGTLKVVRVLTLALILTRHGGRAEHMLGKWPRQVHLRLKLRRLRTCHLLSLRDDTDFLAPAEGGCLLLGLRLLHELCLCDRAQSCLLTSDIIVCAQLTGKRELFVPLHAPQLVHVKVEALLDFVCGR